MSSRHASVKYGIYSIRDLQDHYEKKTKGYWFTKDTMRFFRSHLNESLFYRDGVIYFISSEKGPLMTDKRRYTIRAYYPETGVIETTGLGFQGYKTLSAAILAASKKGVR